MYSGSDRGLREIENNTVLAAALFSSCHRLLHRSRRGSRDRWQPVTTTAVSCVTRPQNLSSRERRRQYYILDFYNDGFFFF